MNFIGKCSCGRPVLKITDAEWTPRTDGTRFVYPERLRTEDGSLYDIFRCESCEAVIDEVWSSA